MNNDPNSDCKQCTESKLSLVHSAHTLDPGCVHTAPRPRAYCAQAARTPRAGCHAQHAQRRVASRTSTLSCSVVVPSRDTKICIGHTTMAWPRACTLPLAPMCRPAVLQRLLAMSQHPTVRPNVPARPYHAP